jgi:hypothetical protein
MELNAPIQNRIVGIIGSQPDPVAQLISARYDYEHTQYSFCGNLPPLKDHINECVITSHHIFLASLSSYVDWNGPITIIVRRKGQNETATEWQTSLTLLRAALKQPFNIPLKLMSLTATAAHEIATILGCSVSPLDQLPALKHKRTKALIDINANVIRLSYKGDETTMPIASINWGRIRRHVRLDHEPDLHVDLQDIASYSNECTPNTEPNCQVERTFIFIISNGVGLGHLTRQLAVAKKIKATGQGTIIFWSYSRAATLIEQEGFLVYPRQTAEHLNTAKNVWRQWECADLIQLIKKAGPVVLIMDGSTLNSGLTDALQQPGCSAASLVWVRRGMWHVDADASPLDDTHFCDLILEPNDIASSEDHGPTAVNSPLHKGISRYQRTEPVSMTSNSEALSRYKARIKLGHWSKRPLCLINLGGDALSSNALLTTLLVRISRQSKIRFIWARSPFSSKDPLLGENIEQVSVYPLGPILPAFDGIISAAGYNSFHESLSLSTAPILFSPTIHARLDNQYARAHFAQKQGWADIFDANGNNTPEQQLIEFLKKVQKRGQSRIATQTGLGAQQMAEAIIQIGNSLVGESYDEI